MPRGSWSKSGVFPAVLIVGVVGAVLLSLSKQQAYRNDSKSDALSKNSKVQSIHSAEAFVLDFEFMGEIVATSAHCCEWDIQNQILYTVGQLNNSRSISRTGQLKTHVIEVNDWGENLKKIRYKALLPVTWGNKSNRPTTYEFLLPLRMDAIGLQEFVNQYGRSCVTVGARNINTSNMFYYYRPYLPSCALQEGQIYRAEAKVKPSQKIIFSKFPEYHKLWEDGRLEAVIIFSKASSFAMSNDDNGIKAYNRFVELMKNSLGNDVKTIPAYIPTNPGISIPEVKLEKIGADNKIVQVIAMLIDSMHWASASFFKRYRSLTPTADLIGYFGQSGSGANIKRLANNGLFATDQYQIFVIYTCDTFAYINRSLAIAHRAMNPDDSNGTRYLDVFSNVIPTDFYKYANNAREIINALIHYQTPMSYQEIMENIAPEQMIMITGEQDNIFEPSMSMTFNSHGFLFRVPGNAAYGQEFRYTTNKLPAGDYVFATHALKNYPISKAQLIVRIGQKASLTEFDCRQDSRSVFQACALSLDYPSKVHFLVVGNDHKKTAYFEIIGRKALAIPSSTPEKKNELPLSP